MEVFLYSLEDALDLIGLLHARGGVSAANGVPDSPMTSSPRSWRCFFFAFLNRHEGLVFSTLVEVFLFRDMPTKH